MPRPPRIAARAKPHSKKAIEARNLAAMGPGDSWSSRIIELLEGGCHPFQLGAVRDPSLRISILAGRGGGKTTAKRVRALRKMVTIPRARIAYAATSRPEAERLNWEPTKQLIEELGEMDNFEFSEARMRCTCKITGATYQFFGADDKREVNKLRGQPFDEFQVDETASHSRTLLELMLDQAVGPRLGERKGCIVLGGTPGSVLLGRFYDVTRPGSDLHRPYHLRDDPDYAGWVGWSSHAWSMPKVLSLPGAAELYPALALNWAAALEEKKRQGWSDDNPIWRREYLGEWAADNTTMMYAYSAFTSDGTFWNRWDPLEGQKLEGVQAIKAAIAKLPEGFSDWLFGYGQDLGARDPYALDVFAFSPSDEKRRFFHVFSFDRKHMYARLIAELLIGKEAVELALRGDIYKEVGGLFGVTDWPAAIVADLAGLGETLIDELANVYGIHIKPAQKAGKMGAIEVFNGDLADGRMFILADSPLESQLATLQWKPDDYGQPREDKAARNDHADAATYIRTEIGTMFSGVLRSHIAERDDGKKRTPRARTERPPPREISPPKPRGEFDALLWADEFTGLD